MAHHEKLPTLNPVNRSKVHVNGTGHEKDLLISFNQHAGWYVSGSDVVFSSAGVDRVIYGLDHTTHRRPILISDFDHPPQIHSGGLLFKHSGDSSLWWRTHEGDQRISYPPHSAAVYKKFNEPGLFYQADGVEQRVEQISTLPSQTESQPSSQPAVLFPLTDTQTRDAAQPSFAIQDSGMFLDSNGNLSFSVNKMLNTTMHADGTIITDGYLFMDGHSIRSTPTELILTAGAHPVKINNGNITARMMQSQAIQADAIKTTVLSARVITGQSGPAVTINANVAFHTQVTFDQPPEIVTGGRPVSLSTYKPSLSMPSGALLAGDMVCINAQGEACRYTGGYVRNIDAFLLADYIFFKSNGEMLSNADGHITYTRGDQQHSEPGYALSADLYVTDGHLYRSDLPSNPATPTAESCMPPGVSTSEFIGVAGVSPTAAAVDQEYVLLISQGVLYVYRGNELVASSAVPIESTTWQILPLPGYAGVISGSYFKIVFLYTGVITWGVPFADYQSAGCIALTYNNKYNTLVSLEKTFLSDSYLQVLDITGLIINKVITRPAFADVIDMAYNERTDSYCLVARQDDQVLFRPFYYDGRDITFALTYYDRKIKTVMSRITPVDDYFIFAYADDCLVISAFYDQRADIVGMALSDSVNGRCLVQTTGSIVELPGELPAQYVGKKIYLCGARPFPDNLKLAGGAVSGILIGTCLTLKHLKI